MKKRLIIILLCLATVITVYYGGIEYRVFPDSSKVNDDDGASTSSNTEVLGPDPYREDELLSPKEEFKTEVSFMKIEQAPIFPSCESQKSEHARKKCLQKKISRFVSVNFNTDLASELGLDSGRKRIMVQFKIDQNGDVTEIKVNAPHPSLKKEATRIIKKLPRMIPGKMKGEPVSVKYALPINFIVE